jgi:predicted TIM-barrel fold metal-dependent hydrolase
MNIIKTATLGLIAIVFANCTSTNHSDYYSPEDFRAVEKIDAHIHIESKDSTSIQQATDDNFELFTINYDDVNEPPPMEFQQDAAVELINKFPARIAYATTISIRNFNSDDWMDQTIAYVKNSLAKGAKAVKIYKVIGMSLRNKQGKLVMIDDPAFDSLFKFFEENNIPVVGHLGEPRNCWLPADKMTIKGDIGYFTSQPQYHMYKHPEFPSYEEQIRARDNLLAKHPKLTFVGAHLGSLEYDVDSLAARLDKYPNMAVDMAARIVHLELQSRDNPKKVYDFMVKYSDRLLYATDIVIRDKTDAASVKKAMHDTWTKDWKFFTSNEKMSAPDFDGTFSGLKLPKEVVDKIYYKNAKHWLNIFNN